MRFLTADHTHVPKLQTKAPVGPLDRTYEPPFSFRWSYYGETNRSPMLAARLRVNTVEGDAKYGGKTGQSLISHSFGSQIPTAKYGKEHPEYFALRGGKRLSDVRDDWSQSQPCLTNPDVLRIVKEAVLAELKAHPERENISVSQNDNAAHCLCPKCKAIDDREGTPMGTLPRVCERDRRLGRQRVPEGQGGDAQLLVHPQAAQDAQAAAERADPALQHRVLHDPPDP